MHAVGKKPTENGVGDEEFIDPWPWRSDRFTDG
jgi:hypothetical protein